MPPPFLFAFERDHFLADAPKEEIDELPLPSFSPSISTPELIIIGSISRQFLSPVSFFLASFPQTLFSPVSLRGGLILTDEPSLVDSL